MWEIGLAIYDYVDDNDDDDDSVFVIDDNKLPIKIKKKIANQKKYVEPAFDSCHG
jgi:hypothetical protein